MNRPAHAEIAVYSEGPNQWFSKCRCGWVSTKQEMRYDAEQEFDDHLIYVARFGLDQAPNQA